MLSKTLDLMENLFTDVEVKFVKCLSFTCERVAGTNKQLCSFIIMDAGDFIEQCVSEYART